MKLYFIGLVVGVVSSVLGFGLATLDTPRKHQIGMTYNEIEAMIEACELKLPRNKSCVVKLEVVEEGI